LIYSIQLLICVDGLHDNEMI